MSVDPALADATLATAVDTFWLLFCGVAVFHMQIGFTMLETGSVRLKNTLAIMLKNVLDACVSALMWFVLGESIMVDGTNSFLWASSRSVLLIGRDTDSPADMATWFLNFAYVVTATTIVSGAMAERTHVTAYLVASAVIAGFIYPSVARWIWHPNGWLSVHNPDAFLGGMVDWAGSCAIHLVGGAIALVGAAIVGPRRGRFDSVGKPVPMPGSNAALQVLGALVLWVCWYGFNISGSRNLTRDAYAAPTAARIVVTTTLSSASAGFTACFLDKFLGSRTWSVSKACNGILCGLVSVTAGCASIPPQLALVVGVVGALVYLGSSRLVLVVLKVDDPLDAFAVHGACGIWGTLAPALFANPIHSAQGHAGLFYGSARLLGAATVGMLAVIGWSACISALLFLGLKRMGYLRVDLQAELIGLDVLAHGGDISVAGFHPETNQNIGADMQVPLVSPSNSYHHRHTTDGSSHGVHRHKNVLLDRFANDSSGHGAPSGHMSQHHVAMQLVNPLGRLPHEGKASLSVHGASVFFTGYRMPVGLPIAGQPSVQRPHNVAEEAPLAVAHEQVETV